ncbi:PucR family transcriptional regulator [Lysinibacillus xylanilyticus]|uniref:PucR family transcriptional regulator n=1 Tax=Lysinibacillus xylanilyticus TaxID=582475 RepID=UPI003D05C5E0
MLTIKDILETKAIEGIKIVAGEQGIHNKISLVNIIENPDAFDWLTPNELLLTTGYIFQDDEELQNRIIKEISKINCSGLVIKMRRYLQKTPQNMIDTANKYGLPLLELPYNYTLSKVISIINEKASGDYDLINRKSLDMHNTLFKVALEGGGIKSISTKLAETINNPIIFFDKDWNLLHYTELDDNPIPLDYVVNLNNHRQTFSKDFINSIPKDLNEMQKSITRMYYFEDFSVKCRILPVAVANYIYGYIVIWQTIRDLTEFDYLVLEQASTIVALERIKQKEIEEVRLKIKQEFFDDLLTGRITSSETLQTLCDLHGLYPNKKYYCIVLSVFTDKLDEHQDLISRKYESDNLAKKCIKLIHEHSNTINGEITCLYRNNQIIILVSQNDDKQDISVVETKLYAENILELLTQHINQSSFLIGIGKEYKNIRFLHKSFSEAHEALRLMHRFHERGAVAHFADHSIYHFLDSNVPEEKLKDFFLESLGTLFEYDQLHSTSYLLTLENYFINHMNISETAKEMFIHRNTLIYRIDKIKEILKTDFKSYEELLQIQLALRIYRLIGKSFDKDDFTG